MPLVSISKPNPITSSSTMTDQYAIWFICRFPHACYVSLFLARVTISESGLTSTVWRSGTP